jgi:hypothetical protein
MSLEIRKFELRFIDGNPFIYDGDVLLCGPSVFGYVYNQGPIHDHNRHWKGDMYLEDLAPSFFDGVDRLVSIVVLELCPIHIGKDCTCAIGLEVIPRTREGKIILDLYGLIENDGNNECFFQ